MISSRSSLLLAGLLASATFASSGAFAQAPSVTPTPPAAEAQVGTSQVPAKAKRMDRAKRLERMQAQRAERLAALKQKLQLTPAQEGAWSNFAAAQQPQVRAAGQSHPDRAELAKMTTPERLDRMQARHAERSARLAKRIDATRSLYAALTPEQQKTFDAQAMHAGHRGHGHRHHRHGHGEAAKS